MMLAMIFFMGLSSKWNINLIVVIALCVPTLANYSNVQESLDNIIAVP